MKKAEKIHNLNKDLFLQNPVNCAYVHISTFDAVEKC